LARSLVADVHAADDVVQDVCLAALHRAPDAPEPSRGWFVGVVRNLARRAHRSRSRRVRREHAVARRQLAPSAADVAAEIEAHGRVVEAVADLEEPYRGAIGLRYFHGLEPREVAQRLSVPAATARTWIHRGLAKLRERLGRDEDVRRAVLLPLLAPIRPRH